MHAEWTFLQSLPSVCIRHMHFKESPLEAGHLIADCVSPATLIGWWAREEGRATEDMVVSVGKPPGLQRNRVVLGHFCAHGLSRPGPVRSLQGCSHTLPQPCGAVGASVCGCAQRQMDGELAPHADKEARCRSRCEATPQWPGSLKSRRDPHSCK